MSAVTQISSIAGLGVFKNYLWSQTLEPFSKRNLIYGWNYCGKTTLSRVFRSLELGDVSVLPKGAKFSLRIGGQDFSQADVSKSLPVTFRVFNADFVENNLLWGGGAQPLLILGSSSIDIERELLAIQQTLVGFEKWRDGVFRRCSSSENARDAALSAVAQYVKQSVKLQVFNRAPHLADVLRAHQADIDAGLLDESELAKWRSIHTAEPKRLIESIKLQDMTFDRSAVYSLFPRTASRDAIDSLAANPVLEAWVRQGIDLHGSREDCAFCGSHIPERRLAALQGHFSVAVTNLIADIDNVDKQLATLPALSFPSVSDFYEDLQIKFNEINLSLTQLLSRRDLRVKELREKLGQKKGRVEESYVISSRPIRRLGDAINERVASLNEVIADHNERVRNGQKAKKDAEEKLISHYSCAGYNEHGLAKLISEVAFLNRWRDRSKLRVARIEGRVSKLKAALVAASIGSERVNSLIRLYFGSDRLRVVSVDGRYKVHRETEIATSLSEGEKTAISFAYFMARLEEDGIDKTKLVVYIDDPISSLDANHVFNTFAIVRSRLSEVAQLFISTHNYEFFRMMKGDSFFVEFPKKDKRRSSYYQVVRCGDESIIVDLPRALRKFASEYHLLVSMLFEYCSGGSGESHMMPNVMRRVLEAYTSFRFPSSVEKLDVRLGRIFESEVSMRVYKLINHLSHADTVTAVLELPSDEEVREVAQIVLAQLRAYDADHFDGMKTAFDLV